LQRAVSTASREVARHGGRPQYRASEADQQAWESALRPKLCLLAMHVKLQTIVANKLILDWSPEQISGLISLRARTAWMPYSTMAQLGAASFDSSNRQSPLRKNRQFLASN
jgi:IS30 family transposase